MTRWRPDARRRLADAAVELYAERGVAETTVAAIAERAGLTERTFFRHFADKREVLFGNEDELRDRLRAAVVEADDGRSPREAAAAGVEAVAVALQPRRDELRRRTPIVAAHPELQERELMKLASWRTALDDALRSRGTEPLESRLLAELSIVALDVAAQRWLDGDGDADLPDQVREVAAALRALG